ncbi:MAG TPA: F0F1 ATP synthase subunit B [Candidatus Limnocylindrales bacterium]|nr:F0F1 ATP synthase subunit B [Candidatus Limnocylindrales bacterium]
MTHPTLFLDAGPLTLNGTFIVETAGFLLMLLFLSYVPLPFLGIPKPVFPWIISIAEARQRSITEQLALAEKARAEAEARLKEADAKLVDARRTADTVIEGASRSGEQLRQELRQKAESEYQRIVDSAKTDIEAERERALESARDEVAGMVVAATEKVIGETLDEGKHRRLIERAIEEVASGNGRG